MDQFDVCVIGAGPSGYAAAIRATDFGKRVALIERSKLGGTGIHNGALSSKTLWELSQKYKIVKSNDFGFSVHDSEISYTAIMQEMHKAVNDRYLQLKEQLDYFVRKGLISFYHGHGKMITPHHVQVTSQDGTVTDLEAENTVLAVGSRPRKLPSIPIDEKIILTSDGIGNLQEFPESIVILGAGVIGCEFATIFSNFQRTKVYLIDKAERILPFEDEDIAQTIASNLEENGVHIHRGASLKSMQVVNGRVEYVLEFTNGQHEVHTVERALVSVGRVPNSENVGLQEIGISLNSRGYAEDTDTQTNVSNIMAVGDFTADIALVNVAELEGRHAIERLFDSTPSKELHYRNISTIMFLNPEVASVGLNETQARKQGIPYKMAKLRYKYVNRAIAMRQKQGFIKLLVTDDEEMHVLGMRVLGDHASSTIEAIALLISIGKGIRELAELIHPHPSIPEGIQECARMLLGRSIIKPQVFARDTACYRVSADGKVTVLNHFESDQALLY